MSAKTFNQFSDMTEQFCGDKTETCGLAEICRDERFERNFKEVFHGADLPEQDPSNGASNFLDLMIAEAGK